MLVVAVPWGAPVPCDIHPIFVVVVVAATAFVLFLWQWYWSRSSSSSSRIGRWLCSLVL